MFYYCCSLTSLNLSDNVNNMSYMFSGCSSLISLNTKDKKYLKKLNFVYKKSFHFFMIFLNFKYIIFLKFKCLNFLKL